MWSNQEPAAAAPTASSPRLVSLHQESQSCRLMPNLVDSHDTATAKRNASRKDRPLRQRRAELFRMRKLPKFARLGGLSRAQQWRSLVFQWLEIAGNQKPRPFGR